MRKIFNIFKFINSFVTRSIYSIKKLIIFLIYIFIEKYNKNGIIEKIFINERINENNSKIIIAEKAKIIMLDDKYKIKLLN